MLSCLWLNEEKQFTLEQWTDNMICYGIRLDYHVIWTTPVLPHWISINFDWPPVLYCKFGYSLAPWKFEWNFWHLIFQIISVNDGWGISCELALRCMSLDLAYGKSTLVQVMAWCHQATSHYRSQCWPRSLLPYGVTRPLWVNSSGLTHSGTGMLFGMT